LTIIRLQPGSRDLQLPTAAAPCAKSNQRGGQQHRDHQIKRQWLTGLFAAAAGFCIVGGQMGANALLAWRHPTSLRATALAFGLGAGRIASIVGPLAAGWVISLGWSSRATFLLAVIPAVCASAAVIWLDKRKIENQTRLGRSEAPIT
jgi:hypothetical protein